MLRLWCSLLLTLRHARFPERNPTVSVGFECVDCVGRDSSHGRRARDACPPRAAVLETCQRDLRGQPHWKNPGTHTHNWKWVLKANDHNVLLEGERQPRHESGPKTRVAVVAGARARGGLARHTSLPPPPRPPPPPSPPPPRASSSSLATVFTHEFILVTIHGVLESSGTRTSPPPT